MFGAHQQLLEVALHGPWVGKLIVGGSLAVDVVGEALQVAELSEAPDDGRPVHVALLVQLQSRARHRLRQETFGVVQGTIGAVQGTFVVVQGTFGAVQGTFGVVQGTFGVVQGIVGVV